MRPLPILDNLDDIRIASPCDAEWDAMRPLNDDDDRGRARFCGSCEKNVYDLSSMKRVDALALVERHEGSCCVRFYRRPDGTVLTADCPVGVRAALRRAQVKSLAGIASCAGAVAAVVSFLLGTANPVSRKLEAVQVALDPVAIDVAVPVAPEPPMMGAMPPREMGDLSTPTPPPKVRPKPHVKMGRMPLGRPMTEVKGGMARPQETPELHWLID